MNQINAVERAAAALKKLMRYKTLRQVRVSEIILEAGISRQAFYSHFESKYDLAHRMWQNEVRVFTEAYNTSNGSIYRLAVSIMKKMQMDRNFYVNLLKDTDDPDSFFNFWVNFSLHKTLRQEELLSSDSIRTAVEMYNYGWIMCTKKWLDTGCIEKAEALAQRMVGSMPAILAPYINY